MNKLINDVENITEAQKAFTKTFLVKKYKQRCINDPAIHGRTLWVEIEKLIENGKDVTREAFEELYQTHLRKKEGTDVL